MKSIRMVLVGGVMVIGLLRGFTGFAQMLPPGYTNNGVQVTNIDYSYPMDYGTNLYFRDMVLSNGVAGGWLQNSTPLLPYTIFSKQSLEWPVWSPEATFYGTSSTNFTAITTPKLGRDSLFLVAKSRLAPRIIGAGSGHWAVIRRDGTVWSWGGNGSGQLGDGSWDDRSTPGQVGGLSNVIALAVAADSAFTLALDDAGKVWGWGAGGSGQLGRHDGLYEDENTAALVPGLSNIVAIAAGSSHALALKSDGTVWAWGDDYLSQLGDGTNVNRDFAARVPGLTNVLSIASGAYHNFALGANGKVYGWGYNGDAELGLGNRNDAAIPTLNLFLTNVVALGGGYFHSIALLKDGTVKAWGDNIAGEIGSLSSTTPVAVAGLSNIVGIACGDVHNLFLDQDGKVLAWGNGGGASGSEPAWQTWVSNVTAVAGEDYGSMVSTVDGKVYFWENGDERQMVDLYADADEDGNGLTDTWEIQHFGYTGVNPEADPDGDGWSNLQEFQNGTDPNHYDPPPVVTGVTATQATNQSFVTVTWNAASGAVAGYVIRRSDFNWDTQSYVTQQIGVVGGGVTTFVDDGVVGGGDGNSLYEVQAVYGGGSSPWSDRAYVNGLAPATLGYNGAVAGRLVRNGTGRWQIVFQELPAAAQTIRLYWQNTEDVYSYEDIETDSVADGIYPLTDDDAVNRLGSALYIQGNVSNNIPGQLLYAGTLSDDAPYFVDGREHLKQNLEFLVRAASLNQPFASLADVYASSSYHDRLNHSATDFEESSFLYHDTGLDDLWPFRANYFLSRFFVDPSRTNSTQYPIGDTNFTFQPDFMTPVPADPILTHADPFWILQPGFNGNPMSYTADRWGVTVSANQQTATLASGLYNLFGLPFLTGCEVDLLSSGVIDPSRGLPAWLAVYQVLDVGDSVTVLNTNRSYQIGVYASWCPAPVFSLVDHYFSPVVNPGANPMALPSLNDQPYSLPIDDHFNITNRTPAFMGASVGEPMILGAWAKYAIANGDPNKFAYLGQYFTTNAFQVDTNGNLTAQTTGIVSPYGEFFPTEPGPVALITLPDMDTGIQATGIVQVISLALDANHDGTIATAFNGADQVAASHPYRFWVNNDFDRGHTVDVTDFEQDDLQTADAPDNNYVDVGGNRVIPSTRDLEDYARLWVCGLSSNVVAGLPAGYTVTLRWSDTTGNPAIDLFQAADADGSIGYLTNETRAAIQIDPYQSGYVGRVAPGHGVQLNANYFGDVWRGEHFIWCGVTNGSGTLTLTIADGSSNVVAQTSTYLQLVDIKTMYERWTVGEDPEVAPATTVQVATNDLPAGTWPFRYAKSTDTSTPYILFVHGWNMETWEKDRFAEAAYKRLYWQGYQGRFGSFRWPTTTSTLAFDKGEWRGWQSAAGLLNLLENLNSQYPDNVHLIAHSQGNIVAGEALKLAGTNQVVNTYIAMQAAVPSHCYDPATPTRALNSTGVNLDSGTPNRYANYFTNGASCYFNGSAGAGTYVNFYNTNDWALTVAWEPDQDSKPDGGYGWSAGTNGIENYTYVVAPFTIRDLYFPQDAHEIFSQITEARCYALGAQPDVSGVFKTLTYHEVDLQQPPYNFQNTHRFHSGEFRSDNQSRWQFWDQALVQMNLK